MSGSKIDQLSLPVDSDDNGSIYDPILNGHGLTWKEVDDDANKRGCGPFESMLHLGITKAEINSIDQNKPDVKLPAAPSASVDLGERALRLLAALDDYQAYTTADNEIIRLQSKDADGSEIDQAFWTRNQFLDSGDRNFYLAYGAKALANSGKSPGSVESETQGQANDFRHSYTGQNINKDPEVLRKTLGRQIK